MKSKSFGKHKLLFSDRILFHIIELKSWGSAVLE